MTIRALIADDERLMREQLIGRLAQAWPELEIVAEATNGIEAVRLANEVQPDIAFLDIRMPGLTGVEVAAQLDERIRIVFVTAYDEYAVAAFEQGAVDYLLKPVELSRLARTVARLQQSICSPAETHSAEPDWSDLLERLGGALRPASSYLRWIHASIGDRIEMTPVDEVLFFQAADKYTRVVRADGEALIRKAVYELVTELDPARFWQVHRASIVNASAIRDLIRDDRGRLQIRLRGSDEKIEVSRTYAYRFRQM
jgi:DNA-binding LytR/AlgR family response regulator